MHSRSGRLEMPVLPAAEDGQTLEPASLADIVLKLVAAI
jgi:hypothetical protein